VNEALNEHSVSKPVTAPQNASRASVSPRLTPEVKKPLPRKRLMLRTNGDALSDADAFFRCLHCYTRRRARNSTGRERGRHGEDERSATMPQPNPRAAIADDRGAWRARQARRRELWARRWSDGNAGGDARARVGAALSWALALGIVACVAFAAVAAVH
jgi:hypothetical protein